MPELDMLLSMCYMSSTITRSAVEQSVMVLLLCPKGHCINIYQTSRGQTHSEKEKDSNFNVADKQNKKKKKIKKIQSILTVVECFEGLHYISYN